MRKILLLSALLPVLGGCASLAADRLPVCDGQARRPANPYGSVLLPPAPAAPEPAQQIDLLTHSGMGGCA